MRHTSCFLVCAALALASAPQPAAPLPVHPPARLVQAEISLDGAVVLEASTGDDGQPDADAVWDYLKSFRFRPTEGFAALGLEASAAGAVLKGAGAPESRAVLIEISHGGRASTRELRLVRAPRDEQGGEWMLDAEEVAGLFNQRMIRRSDVPRLEDPDRSR